MSVNLGIWSKLTQLVVGLVVLAVLLLIFMCYKPLIEENERMRREILKLEAEIQAQEKISRQLAGEINVLQNDPNTMERLARDKLVLARSNETVIYFEPSATKFPSGQ